MKRIDQLTFTRFWALLLVLIYHNTGRVFLNGIDNPHILALFDAAPTAVSYLYVLSGFVMSVVYYRPAEKFDVTGYWTARLVRIYPLYLVSFLLTCYFYLDFMARIKPVKVLVNIFVLQAWWPPYAQSFNYASWSMTVEFFFYALFPFLMMWAYGQSTKIIIWASLSIWAASQLVYFILWREYYPEWQLFLVYNPIFHLNTFLVGAMGGIWFSREVKDRPVNQGLNLSLLFGSLALVCGYIILSNIYTDLPNDLQPMSGLLAPLLTLLIITLALDKTIISKILSRRWMVILGETSYALYILHVPVIWIYERAIFSSNFTDPRLVFSYTALPLMIILGLVACLYIDPPIRAWMRNILKRVSLPLLILDLAIFAASVYLSFRFRFGSSREYAAYGSTALLMFWSAFICRTAISVAFNSLNPAFLHLPLRRLVQTLAVPVMLGSIVVAVLVFGGFLAGWMENFPRSIFLIDFGLVFVFSLGVRMMIRAAGFYAPKSVGT